MSPNPSVHWHAHHGSALDSLLLAAWLAGWLPGCCLAGWLAACAGCWLLAGWLALAVWLLPVVLTDNIITRADLAVNGPNAPQKRLTS